MMYRLKFILVLLALSLPISGSSGMFSCFKGRCGTIEESSVRKASAVQGESLVREGSVVQEKDLVEDQSLADIQEQNLDNLEWWKKANYYHVYLRSFKDSDGDGNGDLRGLIDKLDYLTIIEVDAILLSPFYSSPMKDGGYDIDNYLEISKMFGTMDDYDELYSEAKKRGIRVIVDFVPNHSSNKHDWFWCSERAVVYPKCGKYKDYYIWSDKKRFEGKYPNNWVSVFGGGPAWTWSDIRQQFYFHQFLPEQPDLNFRNPDVREEFKEIARFWLRKADGLRVDALIFLFEDKHLRNDPVRKGWNPDRHSPWERLKHFYTSSREESAMIVRDWQLVAHEPEFEGQQKVIMTESFDATFKLLQHYGPSPDEKYSDLPFNFKMAKLNGGNFQVSGFIRNTLLKWIKGSRELYWPNENGAMAPWILWMMGNHDEHRMVDRVSRPYATIFKWIAYMMPGVPMNYYGDELGMQDIDYSLISKETIDEGEPKRLHCRAPIAWSDDQPSGGFSSNEVTWLPVDIEKNVEHMLSGSSEDKNELKLFIRLQQIRKNLLELFSFGDLIFFQTADEESRDQTLAIARTHEKFGNLLFLSNLQKQNTLVLSDLIPIGKTEIYSKEVEDWQIPRQGKIILVNRLDEEEAPFVIDGDEVKLKDLHLAPTQSLLLIY